MLIRNLDPVHVLKKGDTFVLKRTPEQDDFYHLMNGKFCGEAWDAISRYVYMALQGGSIMRKWTNDDRMMIACCNDGTRPVIFKIERIDISETKEEREWLEKQSFKNGVEDGSWAINTMEDLFLFAMFEIYINLVVD